MPKGFRIKFLDVVIHPEALLPGAAQNLGFTAGLED
jgi:hypothetical protein